VFITTKYSRAWNNFPAGASQVIQSNLFLLRHSPFLAGQISIMSYLYKILLPLPAWCLHIKQVHFLCLYCTCSLELNAGKVECTVQPQRSAKSILHLCIQLSLQFHVLRRWNQDLENTYVRNVLSQFRLILRVFTIKLLVNCSLLLIFDI